MVRITQDHQLEPLFQADFDKASMYRVEYNAVIMEGIPHRELFPRRLAIAALFSSFSENEPAVYRKVGVELIGVDFRNNYPNTVLLGSLVFHNNRRDCDTIFKLHYSAESSTLSPASTNPADSLTFIGRNKETQTNQTYIARDGFFIEIE